MNVSARRKIYALAVGDLHPQAYSGESTDCSSKNGNYVLRYLDQRKIETMSEREFSVNWRHEEGEEE